MTDAPADIRLVQIRRMLALRNVPADIAAARRTISAAPAAFAAAIFREAADSDDVTSMETARDHLAARLTYFADIVAPETQESVRAAFEQLLATWQ